MSLCLVIPAWLSPGFRGEDRVDALAASPLRLSLEEGCGTRLR